MAKRKRDIQLKFRVTPQEREMIETKMAQFGTTNMAAYLRKMAIDGYVVKLDLPELRELVSLLRYSSNNLNQLTRRAHDGTLAIGLDALGGHAHGLQEALGHIQPHVLQRVHHGQDVGLVPACKRVGQHRADSTTQQRHIGHRPEFVPDFLKMGKNASYLDHSGDLCNSLSKY